MKHLITILVATILLSTNSYSQKIGLHIETGISTIEDNSSTLIDFDEPAAYNFQLTDIQRSPAFGITIYDENKYLWAEGSLSYISENQTYNLEDITEDFLRSESGSTIESSRKIIPLSLSAGVKISRFRIGAGSTLNYSFDQQIDNLGVFQASSGQSNASFGYQFILGYKILNNLHIDLRRTVQLEDVSKSFEFNGVPVDNKVLPRFVTLRLSYHI